MTELGWAQAIVLLLLVSLATKNTAALITRRRPDTLAVEVLEWGSLALVMVALVMLVWKPWQA